MHDKEQNASEEDSAAVEFDAAETQKVTMGGESETVSVEHTGDLVRIQHQHLRADGSDRGGQLWLSKASLPWVIERLQAVTKNWQHPDMETALEPDTLYVIVRGSSSFPRVYLQNERAQSAVHGGLYSIALDEMGAESLLQQLHQLG